MFDIIRVLPILLLLTVPVTPHDLLTTEFSSSHNELCSKLLERVGILVKRIDQITKENFHSIVGADRPLCHALYSRILDPRTSIQLGRDSAHSCKTALKLRAAKALASDQQKNLNNLTNDYRMLGDFASILLETQCHLLGAYRGMQNIMKYDNAVTCLKNKILNPPRKLEDTKLVKQCNTVQKRIFNNLGIGL